MAKWRDVKQKKVSKENEQSKAQQNTHVSINSSIPSRLKAFITDSFLITTPIFYIVIYLIMGSGDEFAQNRTLGWGMIIGVHLLIVTGFLYVKRQTPGMRAYELTLIDSSTKQRANLLQILIRYFATTFAIISIFLMFIPFFNKDKKTFQDILSNTININTN
ncbi:MAG: RDD family protein [Sulfurovum sp.]|jgi:uncharacterized RDD family membrane protein YckC